MFEIHGMFGKSDIFLDNIGHNFKTSGWIYFTKTNITSQILSRSDVSKKKVGYPTPKKDFQVYFD